MNTIVDKLLDVDKEARRIMDDAQAYYNKTLEEIETEKEKIRLSYEQKAGGHIKEVADSNAAEAAQAIALLRERYTALEKQVEDTLAAGSTGWQQELFRRCVGR